MIKIIEDSISNEKYFFRKVSEINKLPEPDYVDNYVTDFSGWIYTCITGCSSLSAMKKGKEKEKVINNERIKAWRSSKLYQSLDSNWRMLYNDLANKDGKALKISDLKIRDSAMYGKPDLIFVNDLEGIACIIEIKFSNKIMPEGGWPNARCQLWAYSKADILKKYKKIYLVCENYTEDNSAVSANKIIAIDSSDVAFDKKNQEFFDFYKSFEFEKPTRAEYSRLKFLKSIPQLPEIG